MDCTICNEEIQAQHFPNGNVWLLGYNAQPIKEGRCCDNCWEEVERRRVIAFDVGTITYGNRKIPADKFELKRQNMMSEGEDWDYAEDEFE